MSINTIKNLNIMLHYKGQTYKVTEVIEFNGDYYVETALPLGHQIDCLSNELRHELSWYKQSSIKSGLMFRRA